MLQFGAGKLAGLAAPGAGIVGESSPGLLSVFLHSCVLFGSVPVLLCFCYTIVSSQWSGCWCWRVGGLMTDEFVEVVAASCFFAHLDLFCHFVHWAGVVVLLWPCGTFGAVIT